MINKKEFLAEFDKRFSGFCENAPIKIDYALGEIILDIKFSVHGNEEMTYQFEYDFFKPVKENIFNIHKHLQKYYPIVTQQVVNEEELSVEEIAKLVDEGFDTEEAIKQKKKNITETIFIIDKVLLNQNALVLVEKNHKKNKFKMILKKPVVLLISSFTQNPVKDWNLIKAEEKKWESLNV